MQATSSLCSSGCEVSRVTLLEFLCPLLFCLCAYIQNHTRTPRTHSLRPGCLESNQFLRSYADSASSVVPLQDTVSPLFMRTASLHISVRTRKMICWRRVSFDRFDRWYARASAVSGDMCCPGAAIGKKEVLYTITQPSRKARVKYDSCIDSQFFIVSTRSRSPNFKSTTNHFDVTCHQIKETES